MLSSTSSSNERLPEGPWGRTWLLALGMVAVALGGWEWSARSLGYVPSIRDDAPAWVVNFAKVRDESTVLLGTSRSQSDLEPVEWAGALNVAPPVQLATAGGSTIPLLEYLADRPSFAGLVVVDFVPRIEFDATREREASVDEYLAAYNRAVVSPASRSEAYLRVYSPPLALRDPRLSVQRLLRLVVRKADGDPTVASGLPKPGAGHMRRDRFLALDFTKVDLPAQRGALESVAEYQGRPATQSELDRIISRFEHAVSRIQSRGGKVVFVQLPRCGRMREIEEGRYPRARYWDVLASRTSAVAVNAEDDRRLGGFSCGDGSHLDMRDAGIFTRTLATIVAGRLASTSGR